MAPALLNELLEEALLRVPPDDPKRLVHAALVCKRWRRILADPGFRRRYRELHRSPPMLGFLPRYGFTTVFTPTSSFRLPCAERHNWDAVDARHGRILLYFWLSMELSVLNPTSGEERRLPMPWIPRTYTAWKAALLCAVPGCDHLDCPSGGPFTVVFVSTDESNEFTSACVFSSLSGGWSQPIDVGHPNDPFRGQHSILVGNALYFIFEQSLRILEYDFARQELSVISPPSVDNASWAALIRAKDGGLGFVAVQQSKLCVWSREAGLNGWTHQRVIELEDSIPDLSISPQVAAFVDGAGVILTWTYTREIISIDLKSGRVKKIAALDDLHGVVPYVSFCLPALQVASTSDGPGGRA